MDLRIHAVLLKKFFKLPEDRCGVQLIRQINALENRLKKYHSGLLNVESEPEFIQGVYRQLDLLLNGMSYKLIVEPHSSGCCLRIKKEYSKGWKAELDATDNGVLLPDLSQIFF